MITRLIDKFIFGIALLISLQLPLLTEHYNQFLSGLHAATSSQVEGYQKTAANHHYPSVKAMINHHLQNSVPSVRTDALQKLSTLNLYDELQQGVTIFERGQLIEQLIYMLNPSRLEYLEQTLSNFKPGIPLSQNGMLVGLLVGLFLNYLIISPIWLWQRRANKLSSRPY